MNKELLKKDLAERMKEAIPNPDELARKTQSSRSSIYNYRKGLLPEAVNVLLQVSAESGKSLDWLLTGKEEPRAPDDGFVMEERGERYSQQSATLLRDALDRFLAIHELRRQVSKKEEELLDELATIAQRLTAHAPGRMGLIEYQNELTHLTKRAIAMAARAAAHRAQAESSTPEPDEIQKAS